MKQTFSGLCAAAVMACAVSVAAQSTPTTTTAQSDKYDSKSMTVTGCLEKNKSGGYFLTHAVADTSMTAPTGTTGATPPPATTTAPKESSMSGMTWNLENAEDLDKHVGHKIQVTGNPEKSTSGDEVKGTTGSEIQARDFDVKSVKMIATSCS